MKHNGAVMVFSEERIKDLMRAYDECISDCDYIRMTEIYKRVVNMPSRRFWVSETRATIVINAIIKGEANLDSMWALRREMYTEIYNRVIKLKELNPNASISELCATVISMPAPKFYLTPDTAKVMICKARPKWKKEKLQKLQLLSHA